VRSWITATVVAARSTAGSSTRSQTAHRKEVLRDVAGADHAGAAASAVVLGHVVGNAPEGFFAYPIRRQRDRRRVH
jgi:hypothetical protein